MCVTLLLCSYWSNDSLADGCWGRMGKRNTVSLWLVSVHFRRALHWISARACFPNNMFLFIFTWFSTGVHTLLKCVEAILVPAAASVPEACTALAGGVEVPLEDKLGTWTFLFGKLANVYSRRGSWEGSDKEQSVEVCRFQMKTHYIRLEIWTIRRSKISRKCVIIMLWIEVGAKAEQSKI